MPSIRHLVCCICIAGLLPVPAFAAASLLELLRQKAILSEEEPRALLNVVRTRFDTPVTLGGAPVTSERAVTLHEQVNS